MILPVPLDNKKGGIEPPTFFANNARGPSNSAKLNNVPCWNNKCPNLSRLVANTVKEFRLIRGSIVVSIPACHAGDPGSIPGFGEFFFLFGRVCAKRTNPRGNRTPNLRVWNPTRCHCAMESAVMKSGRHWNLKKTSPRRDSNPQSLPPEGSALSIRPQGRIRL